MRTNTHGESFNGKRTALAPAPRAATHAGLTDVLLISPHECDRRTLERAVSNEKWNVLYVRTCEEALAVMASVLVPVVICDQTVAAGHWKAAIKSIIASPHPAPTLLASESYDWRLWVDIIDNGGFELVAKPFDSAGVGEKLDSAYKHWKQGRTRRTWDHFFTR